MPALRTALVTLAAGGAAVATGVVVTTTSAAAAPAPVAAVSAVQAGEDAASGAGDTTRARPARQWWKGLTDTQRTCLTDAKITRPVGPLDDAARAALRTKVEAAAATCDVTLPFAKARAFWDGLTDTQRTCLKDAAVNRPWGPLTAEQRRQVRADLEAAAKTCGVTLPEKKKDAAAPTT
jgi:hypothetical protein